MSVDRSHEPSLLEDPDHDMHAMFEAVYSCASAVADNFPSNPGIASKTVVPVLSTTGCATMIAANQFNSERVLFPHEKFGAVVVAAQVTRMEANDQCLGVKLVLSLLTYIFEIDASRLFGRQCVTLRVSSKKYGTIVTLNSDKYDEWLQIRHYWFKYLQDGVCDVHVDLILHAQAVYHVRRDLLLALAARLRAPVS